MSRLVATSSGGTGTKMRRSDQVAQDMIEAFRRGAYAIGDALPPEAEYAGLYARFAALVRPCSRTYWNCHPPPTSRALAQAP